MEYRYKVRPSKAMQRVGNCVFNKGGSRNDETAWETVKAYIRQLENDVEKLNAPICVHCGSPVTGKRMMRMYLPSRKIVIRSLISKTSLIR